MYLHWHTMTMSLYKLQHTHTVTSAVIYTHVTWNRMDYAYHHHRTWPPCQRDPVRWIDSWAGLSWCWWTVGSVGSGGEMPGTPPSAAGTWRTCTIHHTLSQTPKWRQKIYIYMLQCLQGSCCPATDFLDIPTQMTCMNPACTCRIV